MNNKGFAITGFIYTIFAIFIILMIAILNMFNSRKNILDKLKSGVLEEVNKKTTTPVQKFESTNEIQEFYAYKTGFYKVFITSPKVDGYSLIMTFEIFLNESEVLYMRVGSPSYNNNNTEISFDKAFATDNIIASSQANTSSNSVENKYAKIINNRVVYNVYNDMVNESDSKIEITSINKAKENEDLNRVQYVKDCIHGGSGTRPNSWSEFKVLVNGVNIAKGLIPTVTPGTSSKTPLENMTDIKTGTYVQANTTTDEACATIDLGRTYNIDSIQVIHESDQTAYGNKLYVSSDNNEYKLIRNIDELEDSNGIIVDAYEKKHVKKVGNIYAPVKTFEGATWLRVHYQNTLDGTLFWDAKAQILTEGGYEALHKQSILYNLEQYKNKSGQFEFMLEYSDVYGYNRWIQTSNPVTESENVTGYKNVRTSWTTTKWYGLALSSSGNTLIDGNQGSNWWYSVGTLKPHQGGIPVYTGAISKGSSSLWVRIDNL